MMRNSIVAIAMTASIGLAGCTGDVGPKQGVGAVAGAVAGGILGAQVGEGEGKAVAMTLGIIAGGLIGSEIGRALDENDRRAASEAEYRALETGRSGTPTRWRNPDSGHYGDVVPGPAYQVNRLDCRDYTHTIYIDGQPETARGTACRQPDGTWRPES